MSTNFGQKKSRSTSASSSRNLADYLQVYDPSRTDYSIGRLRQHLLALLGQTKYDQVQAAIEARKQKELLTIDGHEKYGNIDELDAVEKKRLKAESAYEDYRAKKSSFIKKSPFKDIERDQIVRILNQAAEQNRLVTVGTPEEKGGQVKKEDVVKMINLAAAYVEEMAAKQNKAMTIKDKREGQKLFFEEIAAQMEKYNPSKFNMNALSEVYTTLRREPYTFSGLTQVPKEFKDKNPGDKEKAYNFVVTQLRTGKVPVGAKSREKEATIKNVSGLQSALAREGVDSAASLNKFTLKKIIEMFGEFITIPSSAKKAVVVTSIAEAAGLSTEIVDKNTLKERFASYMTVVDAKGDLKGLLTLIRRDNDPVSFNTPGAIKGDEMKKLYMPLVQAQLIKPVAKKSGSVTKGDMVAAIFAKDLATFAKKSAKSKNEQPFTSRENCKSASQTAVNTAAEMYNISTRGKSREELCDEIFAAYFNLISDKFLDNKKDLQDAMAATGTQRVTKVDKLAKKLGISVPTGRLSDLIYSWMVNHYTGRALKIFPGRGADSVVLAFINNGTLPTSDDELDILAVTFSDINRGAVNARGPERRDQLNAFYQNFVQRLASGDTRDFVSNMDKFSYSQTSRGTYVPRSPRSPRARSPERQTSTSTSRSQNGMLDLDSLVTPAPRPRAGSVKSAVNVLLSSSSSARSSTKSSPRSTSSGLNLNTLLSSSEIPDEM